MLKKIKTSFLSLAALSLLATAGFAGVVSAQPNLQGSLCGGANSLQVSSTPGDCTTAAQGTEEKVNNLITQIVNIISVIVGIIAVIMIIWGGFKYITSSGDSGNVTAAKNTILYAIIGLIIVALAQFIVRFVLAKTTETAS